MDSVITLVKQVYSTDASDYPTATETSKDVLCDVRSVSQGEFFNASKAGLAPAFVFRVFNGEYSGEKILVYNGERYGIYRAYIASGDYVELYAEFKGLTDGRLTEGSDGSSQSTARQGVGQSGQDSGSDSQGSGEETQGNITEGP